MIDVSAYVQSLEGKPVAVFGLARSGLATVRALISAGARVLAWDDRDEAQAQAVALGARVQKLDEKTLRGCAALVLAPGVPFTHNPHPVVLAARAAGTEIISDVEILHRCGHGRKVIGITGTNGKSTTTALIDHCLRAAGKSVACGGNIGRGALDLDMPAPDGFFVLELSSYQLDLCPTFAPDIALLLNITPDHLDRHGDMARYALAKSRIFNGADVAVVSAQAFTCDAVRAVLPALPSGMKDFDFAVLDVKRGASSVVTYDGRKIFDAGRQVGNLTGMETLPGSHNMQNAVAAYAALRACGLQAEEIFTAMKTYAGLPHRQFLVRKIGNVAYVNDSKATNAEAAEKALASYDKDIFWIVGGLPKEGGLNGLEPLMPRVKCGYLIGQASDAFAQWMDGQSAPYKKCGTLEAAIRCAHDDAQAHGGGVVLLSPACASFDQFASYEQRGDVFAKQIEELEI